jgi:hypothetical protein
MFTETKLPNGGEVREYPSGDKFYSLNDKYHRADGPAIECADGIKAWYINDQYLPCTSQEQFERLMKLKAFW